MIKKNSGWIVFLAALGMMLTLTANDIRELGTSWEGFTSPVNIADMLAHMGTVIAAFVAGRLIPAKGSVK